MERFQELVWKLFMARGDIRDAVRLRFPAHEQENPNPDIQAGKQISNAAAGLPVMGNKMGTRGTGFLLRLSV